MASPSDEIPMSALEVKTLDAIADGRPFYEISYPDGRRFGSGTPSSILPVWWATGRFSS